MFNPLAFLGKMGSAAGSMASTAAQAAPAAAQAAGAMAKPAGLFQRLTGGIGNVVNRVGQNAAHSMYGDMSGFDPDIQKLMQRQALMSMGDRIAGRDSQPPGLDAFTMAELRRRFLQNQTPQPNTVPAPTYGSNGPGRPVY